MSKRIFVVTAVLLYSTLQAQSQTLDEVVVTASKKELKQSQTGKVVTVIDQATLKSNPGKSLTEILNQYAGIFTVGANNSPGTNQDLYFRGAQPGNTLILMDGVPVQDPSQISNVYDLNNINPDQIERIEILKGAQSTLWGSDAVAGVINIITKKGGAKKIVPVASAAYGSYNTFKGMLGVNGNIERLSYNLSYNRTSSDGFSAAYDSIGNRKFDKDGIQQDNFQANIGYRFSPALSANFTSNYGKYKAGADGNAYTDDYDVNLKNRNFSNSFSLNYKTERTAFHLVQSIIQSKRIYNDDSTDIGALRLDSNASFYIKWVNSNYKGNSVVTDLYGNHDFNSHVSLVGGLQHIYQSTTQEYKSISNYDPYNAVPISSDSVNTRNMAAYASLLFTDISGFNVEFGGRFNHHSIYGNNATFTFNPSYNIDPNTKVFVNISSAFRTPSLYQLYSEYGNKNLSPEESINYEAGVQTQTNDNKNSFRITAFKRDIKNLIIFYYNPKTYSSQYLNRDEQHDYGFEVESAIAIGNIGTWTNNLGYINGEGINAGEKVKTLYRRPSFTVNSILTLSPVKGLTVIPAFKYVGERIPGPYDIGASPMPAYYTVDFSVSYTIKEKIRIFTDFRNITDQKYFDSYGYNSRRFNCMGGISLSL